MDCTVVVMADAQGVIRFWSRGAELAFGHAAERAVGHTLDLIVPAEAREAHWAGFRRAVAAGHAAVEGEVGPFPVLCADGDVAETPGRLTLIRQADDRVVGAMVVFG